MTTCEQVNDLVYGYLHEMESILLSNHEQNQYYKFEKVVFDIVLAFIDHIDHNSNFEIDHGKYKLILNQEKIQNILHTQKPYSISFDWISFLTILFQTF